MRDPVKAAEAPLPPHLGLHPCIAVAYYSLIPIPKNNNKDDSVSANYLPIALPSMFNKVSDQLYVSQVIICSLVLNLVVYFASYRNGQNQCFLFFCSWLFLDVSEAFDLVDHCILFQKLSNRGLSLAIVKLSWYSFQECLLGSSSFRVSNGVLLRKCSFSLTFCSVFGWLVV